jgi:hypothetical protein
MEFCKKVMPLHLVDTASSNAVVLTTEVVEVQICEVDAIPAPFSLA